MESITLKKLFFFLITFLFLCLLIFFPSLSIKGAKSGLMLWYSTVVPTLLPFAIISNLIIRTDSVHFFTLPLYPLYKRHPEYNQMIPYVLFLGFLCGYPMGGKIINDLVAKKQLSTPLANFLLCVSNNASPMFIIGYVLVSTLHSSVHPIIFFSFLYLPVLLYACFYYLKHKDDKTDLKSCNLSKQETYSTFVDDSMTNALKIILKIGCYIMLFSIFMECMKVLLPVKKLPYLCFISCLEITNGIHLLFHSQISLQIKTALITALTAFGGFCSVAQTKSVLTVPELSITNYIVTKLFFSCCSGLLCYYYLILFS